MATVASLPDNGVNKDEIVDTESLERVKVGRKDNLPIILHVAFVSFVDGGEIANDNERIAASGNYFRKCDTDHPPERSMTS